MLCQNCGKNEANIRYTQIINGVKKEVALCSNCAKKLGMDEFEMPIHKWAAIISAIACIGWCLSANWIPTVIIVPSYAVYLLVVYIIRKKNKDYNCHTWLIAELLAFADTFITYWSLL